MSFLSPYRSSLLCLAAAAGLASAASSAKAATFASTTAGYVQGVLPSSDTQYSDPNAAVGAPTGVTGASSGFPGVVSPFNPAFDTSQIVEIGRGGHLTLEFPQPVDTSNGPSVGVFTNAGLVDSSDPNNLLGVATNPATVFGGGKAKVRVSFDGVHWVSLGAVKRFANPTNYYLNAGPYDTTPPASPQVANFGEPFVGRPASFSGEDYSQILSTLNGSAGGKWFDLSGTGLSQVRFIKFTVPGNLPTDSRLGIDAVAVADGHSVTTTFQTASERLSVRAVPLPPAAATGLAGLAVVALAQLRRRATV